jgi:hypothetical protein
MNTSLCLHQIWNVHITIFSIASNGDEATKECHKATPASSDDEEGSSLDGSTTSMSYEEEQFTPRPKKSARGEEDDDPD